MKGVEPEKGDLVFKCDLQDVSRHSDGAGDGGWLQVDEPGAGLPRPSQCPGQQTGRELQRLRQTDLHQGPATEGAEECQQKGTAKLHLSNIQ